MVTVCDCLSVNRITPKSGGRISTKYSALMACETGTCQLNFERPGGPPGMVGFVPILYAHSV